ncbi:hypothetical protein Lser_V15G05462 [Lactuca serriola]
MEVLKVYEHEHPLTLVNLQVHYEEEVEEEEEDGDDDDDDDDEEKEEEGGDTIIKDGFQGVTCGWCGEEISMYHKFYYKCMADSSCDFTLHKFCAELSTTLKSTYDPHPLNMVGSSFDWSCSICTRQHKSGEICYYCHECFFCIDVNCAVEVGKRIIHHPCHPHSLIWAISQPILCYCQACGKEHKGIFFLCATCTNFTIHSDCAFLPEKLLIQEKTDGAFHHTHPLTISYSFPFIDQRAKHYPRCRVCGRYFSQNHWIYKCDKCLYYAHLDCATSRTEPFMSIFLSRGLGRTNKNYEDVDYPHLLHLPFPDETYSLPKHLFFQQNDHKVNLKHMSHQHPLVLVDQTLTSNGQTNNSSRLLLKCHDPMKKTQLQCNGCLRPIMSSMPFYICANANDDEIQIQGVCNTFALHEWCTRLPPIIKSHPAHRQHTLHLIYSNIPGCFFGVFHCKVCHLPCNGFAYCCVECEHYVDVTCGIIPKQITHEAHPNHLLSLVQVKRNMFTCHNCLRYTYKHEFSFRCDTCDIYIHPDCALLLAKTVRHKYDKHPMQLSYLPIENHKSEYFCEICEQELNPHESFYHCKDCVQSIHTACAPLILHCETHTSGYYRNSIHYFIKVKFGGIHNTHGHPHPLSFAQGILSDGTCKMCYSTLQYNMIFKCLECKFAIHYKCCEKY